MSKKRPDSGFTGSDLHYASGSMSLEEFRESITKPDGGTVDHATEWRNKRPVCPYGCGQEGQLLEVMMKDGKALGIYQDSEQLKFTADLQMAPKPTGRKVVIGPTGEPMIVEG